MPFLKQWYSKYQDDGLVILGVHSPEFDFEKELDNVVMATKDYSISWPVALDNNFILLQPVLAGQIPHRQRRCGALYPLWRRPIRGN